ncbi:Kelch repeat-containing protein [Candidatus Lokiarchaeum ossiferum]|uniref:Kelch repeat-containing protein n=1 Tax=Candidatus Lokiarchaeum ossiferum TaxID=2951803 RepID=UPI00352E55B4
MKSNKISIEISLLILILTFPLFQINFANAEQNSLPCPRTAHSMVYLSQSDQIFLFGGRENQSSNGVLDDTWIFDCKTNKWQEISGDINPGPTSHHGMVYDSTNNRVILYSGTAMWEFSVESYLWRKLNLSSSPPSRTDAGFSFDGKRSQILLFGGFQMDNKLGDLWSFNCSTDSWTQINQTGIKPSGRYGASLMYSVNLDRVYLVGGRPFDSSYCDVWILNPSNNSWQEIPVDEKGPNKRYWMGASFDQKHDKIVFFSGSGSYPFLEEITWIFNCRTESWSELKRLNKPKMRMVHQMVYIESSNKIFLFGGGNPEDMNQPFGDQWYYNTNLKLWREVKKVNLPFLLISIGVSVTFVAITLIIYKKRMR